MGKFDFKKELKFPLTFNTYIRWHLRTCCERMKEIRYLWRTKKIRIVTIVSIKTIALNRSNNRDYSRRAHLFMNNHPIQVPWACQWFSSFLSQCEIVRFTFYKYIFWRRKNSYIHIELFIIFFPSFFYLVFSSME